MDDPDKLLAHYLETRDEVDFQDALVYSSGISTLLREVIKNKYNDLSRCSPRLFKFESSSNLLSGLRVRVNSPYWSMYGVNHLSYYKDGETIESYSVPVADPNIDSVRLTIKYNLPKLNKLNNVARVLVNKIDEFISSKNKVSFDELWEYLKLVLPSMTTGLFTKYSLKWYYKNSYDELIKDIKYKSILDRSKYSDKVVDVTRYNWLANATDIREIYTDEMNNLFNKILKLDVKVEVKFIAIMQEDY